MSIATLGCLMEIPSVKDCDWVKSVAVIMSFGSLSR